MASNHKPNPQWWLLNKSDAYISVFATVARLYNEQSGRRERNFKSARMYGNTEALGFHSFSRVALPALPEDRVKYNIISSTSDAVTSKIGKMKPRVSFLTDGGTFQLGEEAKKLTKFVDGIFYKNGVHHLHQRGFQDATVFDVGALKHFIQGNNIVSERVLATELFVDEVDAMYGTPQCLYQMKFVHKDVMKALYPKDESSIQLSTNSFDRTVTKVDGMEDYVIVIEAWRLPTSEGADDGRHIICIERDYLIDEPYTKSYFPFTFFRWSNRITGFWGQSLTERLFGTQLEINKLLRFIQRSFHLGSAFKIFLEHGSKVTKEHLNNEVGSIVYYTGERPEFYAPRTVNEEVFRHLQFLIQAAYEEAGISQLSATSRKPAGLDSGKALREYNDVETERFAITSQQYEASFLETARQYIDLAKDLKEKNIDLSVVAESRRFIESIKWSDINLDQDQYIMKMFPSSSLPTTPAGRMAFVQEMVNSGYIDQRFAARLLDFPDLESYESLANAPLDDILHGIDDIISRGIYAPPEPFQDLQTGVKLYQSAYLRSKRLKVPEERLELLRRWMSEAQAKLDEAMAAEEAANSLMAPPPGMEPPPDAAPEEPMPPAMPQA